MSLPTYLPAPWLRRLYRCIAPAYDGFARSVSSTAREAAVEEARHILKKGRTAALAERKRSVLVAGCGTGLTLPPLASTPSIDWIEAVDVSDAMLRRARQRVSRDIDHEVGIGLRRADLRSLPYPENSFDLILSLYVLDVLPRADRSAALRSIARVLRPGGSLITATVAFPHRPLERLWVGAARAMPVLLGGAHPVDLRPMLRRTGLDIQRTSRHVQAGLPSHVIVSTKAPVHVTSSE